MKILWDHFIIKLQVNTNKMDKKQKKENDDEKEINEEEELFQMFQEGDFELLKLKQIEIENKNKKIKFIE